VALAPRIAPVPDLFYSLCLCLVGLQVGLLDHPLADSTGLDLQMEGHGLQSQGHCLLLNMIGLPFPSVRTFNALSYSHLE